MATLIYAQAYIEDLHKGEHNLCGTSPDVVKLALMNTSFTFNPATADAWVNTNEITTAGGYSAGGETLTSLAVAGTTDTLEIDGVSYNIIQVLLTCSNNPTWTATGDDMDEVGAAVIYNSTTSKVIGCIDFGGTTYQALDGKVFTINLTNGIAAAKIITSEA